jgi:hypothetical protein
MFDKMVQYGLLLGVKNIKDFEGAWIQKVDDQWIFAVNGKDEALEVRPEGTIGASLKFGHAAIWFNGWLAGIITPYSGEFAAGSAANEDSFIAALDAAIAKVHAKAVAAV